MKVPVGENSSIRLLLRSATYTLPEESRATPAGLLNWPSPVPKLPQTRTRLPSESTSSIRLLFVSETYVFPAASTAAPHGRSNSGDPAHCLVNWTLAAAGGTAIAPTLIASAATSPMDAARNALRREAATRP